MPHTMIATRVRDVMTRDPVRVSPDTTIRELARLLDEHDISAAPVVGEDGRLLGIVSKTDLIRRCAQGLPDLRPDYLFEALSEEAGEDVEVAPESSISVEEFMTEDPITASPDDSVSAIARKLADNRVHRAVVVDRERIPIGIVTSLDLLHAFTREAGRRHTIGGTP